MFYITMKKIKRDIYGILTSNITFILSSQKWNVEKYKICNFRLSTYFMNELKKYIDLVNQFP